MSLHTAFCQTVPTDFFSNPFVGIIGTMASIVGLLLAVYFYGKGKVNRKLTFHVNSVRAVVVKAGQTSKLKVAFNERPIQADVTAIQIALWNQGNQSIRSNDVLKPLRIYTDNSSPILESTIRKTTREIIDLKLDEQEAEQGIIGISWKILETNDGGIIQLIYEGDANVKINVDGIIEGQKTIFEKSGSDFEIKWNKGVRLAGIAMLITGSAVTLVAYAILTRMLIDGRFRWGNDWIAVITPITILISLFLIRSARPLGPPFGY